MTEHNTDSGPSRTGARLLRWLAPVGSLGLLAFLIVRVSACEPEPTAQKAQQASPHRVLDEAMTGQDIARPPVDAGAPKLGYSLEFLGATKAAPMVVGEALDPRSEAPAHEPAVQQAVP